jgi:hypothetical protein
MFTGFNMNYLIEKIRRGFDFFTEDWEIIDEDNFFIDHSVDWNHTHSTEHLILIEKSDSRKRVRCRVTPRAPLFFSCVAIERGKICARRLTIKLYSK